MKYTKKPVTIDAIIWLCDKVSEITDWMTEAINKDINSEPGAVMRMGNDLHIRTLEGVMTASPGDYIIRGVKGEIYACKPDIFAMTYEEAYPVADKMKEHKLSNFELFQVERAKIILNMLDNPDHGIYPTTQAFKEIDRVYKAFVRNECIRFGGTFLYHTANPKTKMDVPNQAFVSAENYFDHKFKFH